MEQEDHELVCEPQVGDHLVVEVDDHGDDRADREQKCGALERQHDLHRRRHQLVERLVGRLVGAHHDLAALDVHPQKNRVAEAAEHDLTADDGIDHRVGPELHQVVLLHSKPGVVERRDAVEGSPVERILTGRQETRVNPQGVHAQDGEGGELNHERVLQQHVEHHVPCQFGILHVERLLHDAGDLGALAEVGDDVGAGDEADHHDPETARLHKHSDQRHPGHRKL